MCEDFIRKEQRLVNHTVLLQKHHEDLALRHIERQLLLWHKSLRNYKEFSDFGETNAIDDDGIDIYHTDIEQANTEVNFTINKRLQLLNPIDFSTFSIDTERCIKQ